MEHEVSIFMAVNYYKEKPEEYGDKNLMFVRDKKESSLVFFGISKNREEAICATLNALDITMDPYHKLFNNPKYKQGVRDIYDVCGYMLSEDLKHKTPTKFKNHYCEYLIIIKNMPDFSLIT